MKNNISFDHTLTVVMAVYIGDNPAHILAAGKSVIHQTRAPDEIIFVVDGPVDDEHNEILEKWM